MQSYATMERYDDPQIALSIYAMTALRAEMLKTSGQGARSASVALQLGNLGIHFHGSRQDFLAE